ncbi:acetate--CoA ligase [Litorilituus sediminis]|uniref:Acetate--CoA ligase n=1 Tax=Litorilituus sediminis TaxID=718192 RepID=A0A4P6PAD2_9GAMM|nr:acetate--CoA ligase [Litorilituus sediminis]
MLSDFLKPLSFLLFSILPLTLHANSASTGHFKLALKPNIGVMKHFNAKDLCSVAKNTQQFINAHRDDNFAVHGGSVYDEEITLERVTETLDFLCKVYREDISNNGVSRLHDVEFISRHFDFYRWSPDINTAQSIAKKSTNKVKSRMLNAIPRDKIFLTKYYTKLLSASSVKTAEFNQALYQIPFDEMHLALSDADKLKTELTRFKFTRQQVIAGALSAENNQGKALAKPLVWISEEALHDVLLQGTGVLDVDGDIRYFNVHRNNGIPYDYAIGKREQARYWYFAEVKGILGYGDEIDEKIAIKPQVTFAGNVKQLGLGKLFMVSYDIDGNAYSRLGVLADQGGAFDNNLFQLDMLVDSYRGWRDYHQANKHLPDYSKAWLLLKKH